MDRHAWEQEGRRIGRFLIAGTLSYGLYFGFYVLLSRWLWVTGPRPLANTAAIIFSTFFNYYLHRFWTFRARRESWLQLVRYLVTVTTATLLQVLLFWFGHAVLRIYDLFLTVLVTGLIACYTYSLHRAFTFKDKQAARTHEPVVY